MPATYTKEVILTGDANPNGDSFTINNLDNVSWVTTSTNNAGVNPIISFTIADWAGSQGSTRTANFAIRHWLYDAGDPQAIHEVAFQIIQHAENQVTVTTTQATNATTPATNATAAPTQATNATAAPTQATNATTPATNATAAIYTITYNANGGAGTTPSTSGPLPLTVANNNFTRAGWTFNNWHTESSGSGSGQGMTYNEGATYNVGSDDILYAQWSVTPTTEAPSIQLTGMLNPPIAPVGGVSAQIPFTVTPTNTNVTWSFGTDVTEPGKLIWVTDANGTTTGSIPTWITNVAASTDAGGNGLLTYTVASQSSTSTGPQGPLAT